MISLQQICIDFISRNIYCVESLNDTPELIGQMLAESITGCGNSTAEQRARVMIRLYYMYCLLFV